MECNLVPTDFYSAKFKKNKAQVFRITSEIKSKIIKKVDAKQKVIKLEKRKQEIRYETRNENNFELTASEKSEAMPDDLFLK